MNTKVTIPCRTIRRLAWQMGKDSYWECVFICLCCSIVQGSLSFIVGNFTGNEFVLLVVDVIEFFITAIVNLGLANVFIKLFRGNKPNVDMVTDMFPNTGNAVITEVLSGVHIFLKTLLLIVPGILEALGDALIYYVRVDYPEMTARECINKSKSIMYGNRWKFVKLLLGFLGWMLLADLPCNIFVAIAHPELGQISFDATLSATLQTQMGMMNQISALPMYKILSMLSIFVQVYILMTLACFYDIASGNLVIQNDEGQYSGGNYQE